LNAPDPDDPYRDDGYGGENPDGYDGDEWCDDDEYEDEDDGQPTEYEEWQDLNGGDDWDHGQFGDEY